MDAQAEVRAGSQAVSVQEGRVAEVPAQRAAEDSAVAHRGLAALQRGLAALHLGRRGRGTSRRLPSPNSHVASPGGLLFSLKYIRREETWDLGVLLA